MQYAHTLRRRFAGLELKCEDLLFLEPFQVGYLPDRVPPLEFAVFLRANPVIHSYLLSCCPSIRTFIDDVLSRGGNNKTVEENCNDLLWEIADLIVYSRYPEVYDADTGFPWDIDEIVPPGDLKGKIVIDAGAGSGKLSFPLARYAGAVFAVEPVSGFRRLIRGKIQNGNTENLFVVDGFLESLPFPGSFADYLFTSNAMGWNPDAELSEIERILKPGGCAVHLFRNTEADNGTMDYLHRILVSPEWHYRGEKFQSPSGCKIKYCKCMS